MIYPEEMTEEEIQAHLAVRLKETKDSADAIDFAINELSKKRMQYNRDSANFIKNNIMHATNELASERFIAYTSAEDKQYIQDAINRGKDILANSEWIIE